MQIMQSVQVHRICRGWLFLQSVPVRRVWGYS